MLRSGALRAATRACAPPRPHLALSSRSLASSRQPPSDPDHAAQSREATQDALYSPSGPSASTSGGSGEPFPYAEPLASERPPSAPSSSASPAVPSSSAPPPPPILEPEPAPEPAVAVARVRRPVGAFRGGLIGFLLGISAVGGYGYFRLLEDYQKASQTLLVSVDELKGSTEQMATHLSRIATLERALAKLTDERATHAEVDSLRAEYRKLLEAEHLDVLNLKAHVWAVEQDLRNLTKRDTSVRI
ncbi:uncharacterized protein JCM10292_001015 [Rhodotorula paludigena]|uniref:uncharacterized protein n=1 Tax=Rhodotorula paludigena TaxID=86838 RepID=UPI00317B0324